MKKETRRRIDRRTIYHIVSAAVLVGSLLFSVFYFRAVFFRTIQSFKDFGLSVAYYFTQLSGFEGLITPTVGEIPNNATEVLPFQPSEFITGLKAYGKTLISKENAEAFFLGLSKGLSTFSKAAILILPVLILLWVLIKNSYRRPNNNYNADTKPLRVYKKIEAATWGRCKTFFKSYADFLNEHRGYILAAGLIWSYNLNVLTIIMEFFAFVFYFAVSFDALGIFTQIAKLAMDLTVAINFLPWFVWVVVGFLIFDAIRKNIGTQRLRGYEARDRDFLESHPGALFVVGKQRAKKTTTITSMALSQAAIFREKAREKLRERDLQFPFFPWIYLEKVIEYGIAKGTLPTLARVRKFIRELKELFNGFEENSDYIGGVRINKLLKNLRERYGYIYGENTEKYVFPKEWSKEQKKAYLKEHNRHMRKDFIFGYDFERYGLEYNNNLYMVDVFESLENYAQSYWIYAAPTPLIVANYAIRTDTERIDNGNFPLFDDDFFSRSAKELKKEYCHILDYNAMRLGKLKGESDPYKDGFEIGVAAEMEHAKERGNQHTRTGKKDSPDCNQHNDLFELDVKMHGHVATIDNYTYFRMLLDDQRPDSLAADDKDLCDIIMIKKTSEAKIVMPGFLIEEAAYLIATKFFDKVYYRIRNLRGDNTLFVYLLKKVYSLINNHYVRIFNQYSVYTSMLRVSNGMTDEKLTDKGKYYLSTKKDYSARFATDAIKEFYDKKVQRSKYGLNDFEQYKDLHPSCEEMKKVKSHFYDQIFEVFEDNSIEAAKRKKYRDEVGVKYVWQPREYPERKQK